MRIGKSAAVIGSNFFVTKRRRTDDVDVSIKEQSG